MPGVVLCPSLPISFAIFKEKIQQNTGRDTRVWLPGQCFVSPAEKSTALTSAHGDFHHCGPICGLSSPAGRPTAPQQRAQRSRCDLIHPSFKPAGRPRRSWVSSQRTQIVYHTQHCRYAEHEREAAVNNELFHLQASALR